jgi:hypothetical protein
MQCEQGERHAERREHLHVREVIRDERRKRKCKATDERASRRAGQLAHQRVGREAIERKTGEEQDVVGEHCVARLPHDWRGQRVHAEQMFRERRDTR